MAVPWSAFEASAPDFAALVAARFASHPHHVLGTLAADGSPRLSGSNVMIDAGEIWVGSMPGAMKARDLMRDPRYALHSAPLDETLGDPDVRVRGTATPLAPDEATAWLAAHHGDGGATGGDVFLLHIHDVVAVTVAGEVLCTTRWTPETGMTILERS